MFKKPKEQAQRFASKFGCPVETTKEMVACLKKVDGAQFVMEHRETAVIKQCRLQLLVTNNDHIILGTSKRFYYRICTNN